MVAVMAKKKTTILPKQPDHHDDHFPLAPKPATSILTITLCALNMLAALVFIYIAMLDLEKRRAWSHACFLLEMQANGIPLLDEEKGTTGLQEAGAKGLNNPDDLKKAFEERKPGGEKPKENFLAVNDNLIPRTKPSDLDEKKQAEILGDDKQLVASLEAETRRIKDTILKDISAAAVEAAKAEKADQRRDKLKATLLPMAADSFQILELAKMVRNLEEDRVLEMLIETYERRMILDILRPVEFHRPGDPNRPYLDLKNPRDLNLKELREKLVKRLDNAGQENFDGELYFIKELAGKQRDAQEKRNNIAFLLFTIAHVLKPDGTLLYENGPQRVQTVVGVDAFAAAAGEFTEALGRLAKRVVEQIENDREGKLVTLEKGDDVRTDSFKSRYPALVEMIQEKIAHIERAKSNLALKLAERDQVKKAYYDGVADVAVREEELLVERARTAKLLGELQDLQKKLFRAQRELSTAASDNEAMAREIREMEQELLRINGLIPSKGKGR